MSEFASVENASASEPIDNELLARIEAAFLTLPCLTHDVFLANRIDDLSYAEIAKRTGVSERRVKREMARAIWASLAQWREIRSDGGNGASCNPSS